MPPHGKVAAIMTHEDDHVRMQGGDGTMRVFCERCGAEKVLVLPLSISEVNERVTEFIRAHVSCEKP